MKHQIVFVSSIAVVITLSNIPDSVHILIRHPSWNFAVCTWQNKNLKLLFRLWMGLYRNQAKSTQFIINEAISSVYTLWLIENSCYNRSISLYCTTNLLFTLSLYGLYFAGHSETICKHTEFTLNKTQTKSFWLAIAFIRSISMSVIGYNPQRCKNML